MSGLALRWPDRAAMDQAYSLNVPPNSSMVPEGQSVGEHRRRSNGSDIGQPSPPRDATHAVFNWLAFYNRSLLHSSLDDRSPMHYEQDGQVPQREMITGELAKLIERITTRPAKIKGAWLIQDENGQPFTYWMLRNRFDEVRWLRSSGQLPGWNKLKSVAGGWF